MKLSEFSTEKALDVLCELSPYVEAILSDEELMENLKDASHIGEAATVAEKFAAFGQKVSALLPIILKKNREALLSIVSILNEKSVEDVKAQNLMVTMKQIKELFKDKDLLDFFKSCTDTEEGE